MLTKRVSFLPASVCTRFRFAQSTSGTAFSSTCDRSCARRRPTRPQGCAGRRTRWASRTPLETSPRAGHAGVVEEVGTATLLLVVAPRRMVVAVVLRARKEVELERHAVGQHIVAMLVESAHAARPAAQDLCSPGEQGVLHDLEEDAAVRGGEVFACLLYTSPSPRDS